MAYLGYRRYVYPWSPQGNSLVVLLAPESINVGISAEDKSVTMGGRDLEVHIQCKSLDLTTPS